jgi:hypothetical protein
LYVLHKNSGELHEVATADDISINIWREENVLFTPYHGDGQSLIQTYNIETDEYRTLAQIEGQGIASIYGSEWMMVTSISLEDSRLFDVYIINDLATNPTTYPLGIQTSNATYLIHSMLSDGSMLLITIAPESNRVSDVYILRDITAHPTVDQLTVADFGAPKIQDVRFEGAFSDSDTRMLHVTVSDDEWRYYTIHVPTRTITQVVAFRTRQLVVQSRISADSKWLAVSIEESGTYSVGVVPLDGSQPMRIWDVGTESYTCLLSWYQPDIAPPGCDLYFGIG